MAATAQRPELLDLFARLVSIVEVLGIPHAFIGAVARNAWGRPRTTTDLDLERALDAPAADRLREACERAGIRPAGSIPPADPSDAVADNLVYRSADGIRIDVLVTKTEFQRDAIARRVRTEVFGRPAWVISVEDLVVYKLIASRPRDLDDIEDVLESQTAAGRPIDWPYIEAWATAWGVEARLVPFTAKFRGS